MSWISPYSTAQIAEIIKAATGKRWLVRIDTTTPLLYCSGNFPVTYDSETYVPRDLVVSSRTVGDAPDVSFADGDGVIKVEMFSEGGFGELECEIHTFLEWEGTWTLVLSEIYLIKSHEWGPADFRIFLKEGPAIIQHCGLSVASPHCDLPFKGALCTYSGGDTRCMKTWNDCSSKSNTANFRGFRHAPPPEYNLQLDYDTGQSIRVPAPPVEDPPYEQPTRRDIGGALGGDRPMIVGPLDPIQPPPVHSVNIPATPQTE